MNIITYYEDPKDGVPYQGECMVYCVSPNKKIYLSKRLESSEGLYIMLYNSTLKPH